MTLRYQLFAFTWLLTLKGGICFLLIPEELPSALSIFYSNVPPVKKGTDSRIGIGFRIGPNADFQVQFELGPQTNTLPIGPNAATGGDAPTSKKRQAQILSQKHLTNPEKWINTWKLNIENEVNTDEEIEKPLNTAVDPTKENNAFVNHLRQLYQNNTPEQS